MTEAETLLLKIRILDDGELMAKRKDGKPLTDQDREQARRIAVSLPGNLQTMTVTAADFCHLFELCRALRLAEKGNLAWGIKPNADDAIRLRTALDYFLAEHHSRASDG